MKVVFQLTEYWYFIIWTFSIVYHVQYHHHTTKENTNSHFGVLIILLVALIGTVRTQYIMNHNLKIIICLNNVCTIYDIYNRLSLLFDDVTAMYPQIITEYIILNFLTFYLWKTNNVTIQSISK